MSLRFLPLAGLMTGLALATPASSLSLEDRTFRAQLTGAQEIPEVQTGGGGAITLTFDEGLRFAEYTLAALGTHPPVAAHLHCARAGENGPIVVDLLALATTGSASPGDAEAGGRITNANVVPPPAGTTCGVPLNNVASLYAAARDGWIYANIHTNENPEGEIRGQLFHSFDLGTGAGEGQVPSVQLPPGVGTPR